MSVALRYEEQLIVDFLKGSPKASFAGVEIAKKAGGRKMFDENPRWAAALLPRLRDLGLIEQNTDGAYRYLTEEERAERAKSTPKKPNRHG